MASGDGDVEDPEETERRLTHGTVKRAIWEVLKASVAAHREIRAGPPVLANGPKSNRPRCRMSVPRA